MLKDHSSKEKSLQLTKLSSVNPSFLHQESCKPQTFTCKICHKMFENTSILKIHMLEEIEVENELMDFLNLELEIIESHGLNDFSMGTSATVNSVVCKTCGKSCKSKKGLEQHKAKAHSKRIKKSRCKLCKKRFYGKYALRFHVNQVHQRNTRINCEICGESIYNKYMLTSHIKVFHENQDLSL